MNITREELFNIPAGQDTDSYRGVSNKFLIEKVEEELDKKNIPILGYKYSCPGTLNQMFTTITVGNNVDGVSMNLGITNSNNKSMRVGIALGALVWACANLEISKFSALRKHTLNVYDDLDRLIGESLDSLEIEFQHILNTYARMKEIQLKAPTIGRMLGEMFFNERILTSSHMNQIKENYYHSGRGNPGSLYDFNMSITDALRDDHPYLIVGRHLKAREYLTTRLNDFQ